MGGPRITCLDCGDIIRSQHVHDWKACSCFKDAPDGTGCYIDGGKEYTRVGGKNWKFTAEPCPFCGTLSNLELVDASEYGGIGIHVECKDCGAQGPKSTEIYETDHFYWDLWNERSGI